MVGDLLRESNASAQLRSALFQVAAGIPGVELVGNVSDPDGRKGVSVALTTNGVRSELIFDPQNSVLLAERQTIVSAVSDLDFPVGTVIGSMTFLQSGIVGSTNATALDERRMVGPNLPSALPPDAIRDSSRFSTQPAPRRTRYVRRHLWPPTAPGGEYQLLDPSSSPIPP